MAWLALGVLGVVLELFGLAAKLAAPRFLNDQRWEAEVQEEMAKLQAQAPLKLQARPPQAPASGSSVLQNALETAVAATNSVQA